MSRSLPHRTRSAPGIAGPPWASMLAFCLCLLAPPAMAADRPDIMIIFDGSGSMWGKLAGERQPKLVLAREALRQSLPRLDQQTRVGLMAFGHRRSGDCADVELVARPAPLDAGRIVGALERLNPKGKGPLTLAIGEAAHALGAATEPASIVLIHDDADNCAPDPCAGIAELKKIYPRLMVHVVSVGVQEDAQRTACFARATGGTAHEAQTPAEIVPALSEALLAAAMGLGTPVPKPQLVSKDMRPSAAIPTGKPGVYLTASLTAGAEPLDVPVRWRVARAGEKSGLALYQQDAASPHLTLPAGRYDIEARLSQVTVRQSVDVDPASVQRVNLTLNAGTIRVTTAAPGGTAPAAGPILTISKPESGAGGIATGRAGEPVLVSNASQSEIALVPGPYVITISHGLFRADRQIVVVAGTRGQLSIPLPMGEIELQATAGAGGPPLADVVFQIFEDDPDAPNGRRELMRSAADRPSFSLPAGTYHVVALQGAADARERITVRPGHVERRTLAIASAQLSLAATLAGLRPASDDSILYRIERVDGAPREVERLTRQTGMLDLAPGRYRVASRLGALNAYAERTVDLKAGAREQLTLDHQAGVVRLILVEPGSTQPAADVFWEIKDQNGQTVWLTSEAQPLGILHAGRYGVRAEHRDRRVEAQIEVRAGDNRVVELVAK